MTELNLYKEKPIPIYSDNKRCIDIAKNARFSPELMRKHIKLRHFFLKHHIQDKEIEVSHVRSAEQFADQLTKAVPAESLQRFTNVVGLVKEQKNENLHNYQKRKKNPKVSL